jgi:hypothetical protein
MDLISSNPLISTTLYVRTVGVHSPRSAIAPNPACSRPAISAAEHSRPAVPQFRHPHSPRHRARSPLPAPAVPGPPHSPRRRAQLPIAPAVPSPRPQFPPRPAVHAAEHSFLSRPAVPAAYPRPQFPPRATPLRLEWSSSAVNGTTGRDGAASTKSPPCATKSPPLRRQWKVRGPAPGMEQRASMYPSETGPFTTAVPTPSPRASRPTRIRLRKLSFTSHGRSPCSDLTFEILVRSQAATASRAWHRTRTRWRCGWCPVGRRAAGAQVHRRHHASVLGVLHNTPNIPTVGRHGTRAPHGLQHPVGLPPPLLQVSTIRLLGGGQGQGIVPLCQGQVLRAHPCLVRITPSSLPLHCPFYRVLCSSGNGVYFCLASPCLEAVKINSPRRRERSLAATAVCPSPWQDRRTADK